MGYSGGEQYEPNAIGYATSPDGLKWTRQGNPIFKPDPHNAWEKDRVTACQVLCHGDWHLMFYIGFSDKHHAQIGLARSLPLRPVPGETPPSNRRPGDGTSPRVSA